MSRDVPRTDQQVPEGYTPAAVLVPLVSAELRQLLFTKRAPDLDAHPGQISFPGGRFETPDETLSTTALRETHEEIGIDPTAVELVGRLEPITTVTGFYVEPLIGEIPSGPFTPDRSEVSEVLTLPIDAFLREDAYEQERRTHPEHGEVTVHYFHIEGHTVWGATASILVQYLEREHGWSPPVA